MTGLLLQMISVWIGYGGLVQLPYAKLANIWRRYKDESVLISSYETERVALLNIGILPFMSLDSCPLFSIIIDLAVDCRSVAE